MKKSILTNLLLLFAIVISCQTKDTTISKLNFGFEIAQKVKPTDWNNFGDPKYILALDSINRQSGKYSASIEFTEGKPDFRAWAFTIPDNYEGKKITLGGYIKTENVSEGYAGLWMRIDPSIAFDNMEKRGIIGTTDWTKYEITLEMDPERTEHIVVGGLLVGKGKMWLDNISVTIDGKDIKNLKPFERKIYPAEKDIEFDNGSKISSISINKSHVESLRTLGLVWGFLKYYHPNVAKGDYNWDYELLRILPIVLVSKNKENFEDTLIKWILSLGAFSQEKDYIVILGQVKNAPDLTWINNSNFSNELTSLLLRVKDAARLKQHYYVALQPEVGNPDFKNENPYFSMQYPDAGFRMLSLFRYWNIIQYFFPYKNLILEDWKDVLEEFIPRFINANNETEYTLTVLELIGRVNDTHANIYGMNYALNKYFGYYNTAIELAFIENKPVVTGFYDEKLGKETGLEVGDIISSINNKLIDKIIRDELKYYPASNYTTKLRDLSCNLLRSNDSIINVEYIRNSVSARKSLKTFSSFEVNIYSAYLVKDTCFKLITKDIAYLNNGYLLSEYLRVLWKEIENTKGLIIDVRNYPSDFVIYELSNYLMPKSTPFVKFTNASIERPGTFTFSDSMSAGRDNENYYKGKVIIIVNEVSQSSAEYHAMAYRVSPNVTVIGSTTAGADGNVSQFFLPGGLRTMISGIGIYYPDGRETQRIGIVPDIEVKPTIEGIRKGQDELLIKAIEIINAE